MLQFHGYASSSAKHILANLIMFFQAIIRAHVQVVSGLHYFRYQPSLHYIYELKKIWNETSSACIAEKQCIINQNPIEYGISCYQSPTNVYLHRSLQARVFVHIGVINETQLPNEVSSEFYHQGTPLFSTLSV